MFLECTQYSSEKGYNITSLRLSEQEGQRPISREVVKTYLFYLHGLLVLFVFKEKETWALKKAATSISRWGDRQGLERFEKLQSQAVFIWAFIAADMQERCS